MEDVRHALSERAPVPARPLPSTTVFFLLQGICVCASTNANGCPAAPAGQPPAPPAPRAPRTAQRFPPLQPRRPRRRDPHRPVGGAPRGRRRG